MTLHKETYVGNGWKTKKSEQVKVSVPKGSNIVIKQERISFITETVARWRKANHIHAWFVENVCGDEDDCGRHYVRVEQLEELLSLCERVIEASELVDGKVKNGYHIGEDGVKVWNIQDGQVIKNPSVAKKLLPTQSGFFFGSQEYDKWYLEDVIYTAEVLKGILAEPPTGADYYYEASW